MFNLFKKKKQLKPEDNDIVPTEQDHVVDSMSSQRSDTLNVVYSSKSLPENHNHKRVYVDFWEVGDGDFVTEGELVGKLRLEREYGVSIKIVAEATGVIEIFKESSNDLRNPNIVSENEKLYTIYRNADEEKVLELKNRRFENTPIVGLDDFTGIKEIKWESVAGQAKSNSFHIDIADCFVLFSDDKNWKSLLMFTLQNSENKDYIIFKFLTSAYKITVGAKISFLFENGEVLEFEILSKPHKFVELDDWGHVFETRVPLTSGELHTLQTQDFSKWQIEFVRTEKKVRGVVDSENTQFAIKKLVTEYSELVRNEIENYQPLIESENLDDAGPSDSMACYVYLMMDLTNNYHKIGISNRPEYREKTLQSEKPTVEMLCNKRFPNRIIASSFEQALHQAYADKRIRGEWFNLTMEDVMDLKETLTS